MELIISYWMWLILACLLMTIEILTGTAFFLWLSISSAIVGVLVFLNPEMSWYIQLTLASILTIMSILIWKRWGKMIPATPREDNLHLNRRGQQYVGRTFVLVQAIENGSGKIKVDDSLWKVSGEDAPIGTKVKVVEARGVLLSVEIYTDP